MLIVGANLQSLVEQYHIVDNEHAYDVNSLVLRLDRSYVEIRPGPDKEITYGQQIPDEWIHRAEMYGEGVVIPPQGAILACSKERVSIPAGYFGLVQTKGSLARLFVTAQCSDGQVEAGYRGKITLEVCNLAPFRVRLLPGQKVAQLFIFKTSLRSAPLYEGRYQGADAPTIQVPE